MKKFSRELLFTAAFLLAFGIMDYVFTGDDKITAELCILAWLAAREWSRGEPEDE